jgi:hypothetical protein
MSWHIEFHAASKASAIAQIDERQVKSYGHFPVAAASVIKETVALLATVENSIIYVKSSGHNDASNGNVETTVRLFLLV